MEKNLNLYIQNTIKENWEQLALTDFKGVSFQYRAIARKIEKLHILFEEAGIKKGDKIAICGKNSAHWAISLFATITYGAVGVPILHEFKSDNIHHIVNHCEARLFFCDQYIWENLNPAAMANLEGVIQISDYSLLISRNEKLTHARENLNALFGAKFPERFTPEDVKYHMPEDEELALINYTSGSTGFSKGVMIPYRSLTANVTYCLENLKFLKNGDQLICMLPMAHMYGLTIEMMHPFIKGCHLYFLTRVPSPKIIMEAFSIVKPKLIITVPLIIEKIIKTKVFPMLEKPLMKLMLKVPFLDDQILNKVKAKLTETFGGNLEELIIGGAALNKDVDIFLRKIGFPVTVGYGMTECGPLITYAPWNENKSGSCGRGIDCVELSIQSEDPENIAGELWVKGSNTMLGYYKNEEATRNTIKDGWLNTGDLCTIDSEGFLFIRGRSKNMILGPSGQNIYPEEIEQQLNNLPYVNESIVIDEDGKLVALVYPDIENGQQQGLTFEDLEKIMNDNIVILNKELPAYSKISRVKVYHEEFEKTPKRSIKRYLYQHS